MGLRRGVAGDVVLLLVVVSGFSIVDYVFVVFFVFQFADVLRNNKPCITVLQIITLNVLRFFIKIHVNLTVIYGVERLDR